MRSVVKWAISNGPAMNLAMLALLLAGFVSMYLMRRETFPSFELEMIYVSVPYPGASPEEVEDGICRKLEEPLRSVDGVKKMISVAREGSGFVILELNERTNVSKVLDDVTNEVNRIPSFPELAEDPTIQQIVFRSRAIDIGIVEDFERQPDVDPLTYDLKLRDVAEHVRDELISIKQVSTATIVGSPPYEIDVEVPEEKLREYNLTLGQIAQNIRRENLEIPGGSIKTDSQEVLLRGSDKRVLGEEIKKIQIQPFMGGEKVRLADIANVTDGFDDSANLNLINGKPGIVITIERARTEDLIVLNDAVKKYAAGKTIPQYKLIVWGDESIDVQDRMWMLISNGTQGLVLVFLVLALFLEIRVAFWVALGIPVSMLGAGMIMLGAGQTLNMLTMFSFLLTLGIVVDDAIVVSENIYRHRAMGKSQMQAAIDGTVEVIPSIFSSVMTTVIAFLPLMFVSGVMGKFIAVMPLAVISMLLISLFESALILPCHLAHRDGLLFWFLGKSLYPLTPVRWGFEYAGKKVDSGLTIFLRDMYGPVLAWCLRYPLVVVAVSVTAAMLTAGSFFLLKYPAMEVFPKTDARSIAGTVLFPDGVGENVSARASEKLEAAFLQLAHDYETKYHKPLYDVMIRRVGGGAGGSPNAAEDQANGSHVAFVSAELVPGEEREWTSIELGDRWRDIVNQMGGISGAESVTFGSRSVGPAGKKVEFKLLGSTDAMKSVEETVEAAKAKLRTYPGIFDIDDDSRPGNFEYRFKLKETAQILGVSLNDIAEAVRSAYYGAEALRVQRGRHEVKILVRYPQEERASLSRLNDMQIRTPDGVRRPLSELAEVTVTRGYSEINRLNQKRSITVSADAQEEIANTKNIVDDLKTNFFPELLKKHPGVSLVWEGQAQNTQESLFSLFIGFGLAAMAMYILLCLEFKSYFQPLMVMVSIPFGFVGAVWGHMIMGMPVTFFSIFGLIALSGVVVNDSIVLIDFINHEIRNGMPLRQALLQSGKMRFRAVMLTSATTIAGLIPMLMETSFQAQFLVPMATSLAFGLMLTTVLVLIQMPVLYLIYESSIQWLNKRLPFVHDALHDEDDDDFGAGGHRPAGPTPNGHTASSDPPFADLVEPHHRDDGAKNGRNGRSIRTPDESTVADIHGH